MPTVLIGLVGLVGAVVVLVRSTVAFRDRSVPTDITQQLDHWLVHGAFALATVATAALAFRCGRGGWLPAMSATLSAIWFGVTSMIFPAHHGSLGSAGGGLAIAWGIAVWSIFAISRSS